MHLKLLKSDHQFYWFFTGGTSKFRGNPNFCATFSSHCFSLCGRFYITFFQVSWWSLDCVWKWYRNHISNLLFWIALGVCLCWDTLFSGERGGSVVECRTPEREVRGSRPTAAVLCPWARHFTPRKYWLITQEAMAPSRHDWKIVDWDVKPQHNQPTNTFFN